jgi:CDP-diacylglycerol--glycerol-3-phosphate 3-phosphatidyltransferase
MAYNKLETLGRKVIFTLFKPIIWAILKLNISPNVLTIIGLLINIAATVILIYGAEFGQREELVYVAWAGFTILLGGVFDMLDGLIAKEHGKMTKFGALFDSVIDRYSELFMFFGIAYFLVSHDYFISSVLTFLALIGSVMVSYTRARAEGLNISCSVGLMQRPLRIVLIGFSAVIAGIVSVNVGDTITIGIPNLFTLTFEAVSIFIIPIILVAIFANFTAIQRMLHAYKELKENE